MNSATLMLVAAMADGRFHTGDELGSRFGVTRAAIWKAVRKIPELGLEVHSVRGKGYRLSQPLTLLDGALVRDGIVPDARQGLQELELLGCVDSTNSHTLRRIQSGDLVLRPGCSYACLAEMQTAGRGRRGRAWVSPFGHNLYLSLCREFGSGASGLEGLSLVIGIALVRALQQWGLVGLGLKWPNDVLCNGRKLAGILIEISGDVTGQCQVVIGVGMNLKQATATMAAVSQPWTSLEHSGFDSSQRNQLFGSILGRLLAALDHFQQLGFQAFVSDWDRFDVTAGRELDLTSVTSEVCGTGCGVDASGALLLQTEAGLRRFHGGEVSLRTVGCLAT